MSTKEKLRVVFDCKVLLVAAPKEKSKAAAWVWQIASREVRMQWKGAKSYVCED